MYLNFLLVSFSVFYSKYSYCYEVPENMPLRYFDGTVWKIMKSREQIRIVPTRPNISIELDWPESSSENNKTENKTTSKFAKTFRATTKRFTTKKVTNKVTAKATTKKCVPCGSKCILKRITTHNSIPRAMKPTTKKPNLRTTKRPPAKTTKKFVKITKKTPARTTKKPPAKTPAIFAKKYIAKPNARNASLNEQQALPENWLNVIKDLVHALKIVEKNKNNSQCETGSSPELNPQYPLNDGRRADRMDGVNDIMNLLMDGVEIDDSPDEVYRNGSDYSVLPGFRGLLEDQDTMLDLNEIEKLFPTKNSKSMEIKDPTLNKLNVQNLDLESIKDAIEARYEKGSEGKSLHNRQIEAYLDLLKSRYAKKDILHMNEAPLNLAAINAVIETKHPENPEFREQAEYKDSFKESDLKTYLDAKKSGGNIQNQAIQAYLDLLKSRYTMNDTSQNGDVSLDLDAVDPVVETHKLNDPGFRELFEYKDKALLELDLKPYLDAIKYGKDATKYTTNKEKYLHLKEVVMATKHPDNIILKEPEVIQDDFQGIDLSPYLNSMNTRYAAKTQDRSQDIYTAKDKDTLETKLFSLDEIEALIASKNTDTVETKQSKYKKHIKEKDMKDFSSAMTSVHFTKDNKKSDIRDVTLELDGIVTNEDNDLNSLENVEEQKHNDVTDIELEQSDLATDDKGEQKESDTKEEGMEDVDWPEPNFKYILDDREQNETREDNAFTWDDGGEIFLRPETRPTLAP